MHSPTPIARFTGNFSDIDLRLLRVFRKVVESQGFTGAELSLGMDKSTVSKHITNLEIRLGMPLCRRGRSGFSLTEEGEQIYRAALQLFTSLEDFRTRVNSVPSRLAGTLGVGIVDTIVTDVSSPLRRGLACFHSSAPDVHIRLSVGTTAEIENGIVNGSLHVGVVVDRSEAPGLISRPLYQERSLLYCSSEHPLFRRPDATITPDDLAACALVKCSYGDGAQVNAFTSKIAAAATADHAEAVALLVLSGKFIGFLPEHYGDLWVSRGEMRALAQDMLEYFTPLVAVTRVGMPHSRTVEHFLDQLTEGHPQRRSPPAARFISPRS